MLARRRRVGRGEGAQSQRRGRERANEEGRGKERKGKNLPGGPGRGGQRRERRRRAKGRTGELEEEEAHPARAWFYLVALLLRSRVRRRVRQPRAAKQPSPPRRRRFRTFAPESRSSDVYPKKTYLLPDFPPAHLSASVRRPQPRERTCLARPPSCPHMPWPDRLSVCTRPSVDNARAHTLLDHCTKSSSLPHLADVLLDRARCLR